MSDHQSESETAKPGTSRLRLFLFMVLGLLLVGLPYDFLWARKQHRAAAERLDNLLDVKPAGKIIASNEPITMDQVHETMGCEPSQVIEEDEYLEEIYSWRSGLPWRTHDIYVIYNYYQPRHVHSHSVGVKPDSTHYPRRPRAVIPKTPQEAALVEEALKAGAAAREKAKEQKKSDHATDPSDPTDPTTVPKPTTTNP